MSGAAVPGSDVVGGGTQRIKEREAVVMKGEPADGGAALHGGWAVGAERGEAGAASEVSELGSWRIAARVFLSAPRRLKLFGAGALLYAAVMTAWMVLALGWGALVTPQFWGGVGGGGAGVLLSMAHGLFGVAQGSWSTRWQLHLQIQRLHQMMLAMPILAFAAGLLATVGGVAVWPLIVRSSPIYILPVLACLAVIYFAMRAVGETTRFLYRHAEEQAAAAARARAEATNAQLVALQAQMNPHFLFNALNTIAALVRTDPGAAERTVEGLAAILRRTLQRSGRMLTTVEEEIDFLRAYLSIEQERLGERLMVAWAIEPPVLTCLIPPMLLQPLVENALKHGIGGRLEGGRIDISARLDGECLVLAVGDDGVGFPRRIREGTGLGNLRQRLYTLYGEAGVLRVETPGAGARVVVEVPLRVQPEP